MERGGEERGEVRPRQAINIVSRNDDESKLTRVAICRSATRKMGWEIWGTLTKRSANCSSSPLPTYPPAVALNHVSSLLSLLLLHLFHNVATLKKKNFLESCLLLRLKLIGLLGRNSIVRTPLLSVPPPSLTHLVFSGRPSTSPTCHEYSE